MSEQRGNEKERRGRGEKNPDGINTKIHDDSTIKTLEVRKTILSIKILAKGVVAHQM